MRILSIDLGYSTGIAFYNGDTIELNTIELLRVPDFINGRKPEIIILERMPNRMERTLSYVYNFIEMNYVNSHLAVIAPSEWKPFVRAQRWDSIYPTTVHERDALNMLRYYLKIHEGVELEC